MKKMFLLGDGISLHYAPKLKSYLSDKYLIKSKLGEKEALENIGTAVGANCGDSARVLEYIQQLDKENLLDFDIFVFNCGLHDIKRVVPEENYQITIDEYEKNLDSIFKIIQSRKLKCVFITTTPVIEKTHNVDIIPAGVKRYNSDVRAYNEVAVKIAKKYDASIIDLYSLVDNLDGDIYVDYAHFNFEARKLQAAYIAGSILSLE